MTRRRCTPGGVALIAGALVVALLLMPTASAASTSQKGGPGPCVGIQGSPPGGIYVNPDCVPIGSTPSSSSSSNASPMSVDATLDAPDVAVSWTYDGDANAVAEFTILRGIAPFALSAIATEDPDERAFLDEDAITDGNTLWYAVQAKLANGTTYQSQPVLITAG